MFDPNQSRPLSRRKTAQLIAILTVFAWATQTLLHQWGFGAEVSPNLLTSAASASNPALNQPPASASESNEATAQSNDDEKFVPGSSRFAAGATFEMRSEATVVGGDVKLKQVGRWSDSDAVIFAPIADLVLMRLGPSVPYRAISIDQIKSILHDAGVNVAAINFAGTLSCRVNRSDVRFNEGEALQKWIDANGDKPADASALAAAPATQAIVPKPVLAAAVPATAPAVATSAPALTALRDILTNDISVRLGIPVDQLQMSFHPQDDRVLSLSEPLFKFQVDGYRVRDLGEVSWNVTIVANGSIQKINIGATARAWQNQLVIAKPLSARQVIREGDFVQRRALVDHLLDDTLLDQSQVAGQQAARDLKPGTLLTGRLVDAVQLVKPGQFVTVVFQQGSVELKSVARAIDGGSFGQSIRVKNEATRDIFEVVLTGPQTASMTSPGTSNSPPGSATVAAARD